MTGRAALRLADWWSTIRVAALDPAALDALERGFVAADRPHTAVTARFSVELNALSTPVENLTVSPI